MNNLLRWSLIALLTLGSQRALPQEAAPFDALAIVNIHSAQDAIAARAAIIREIWNRDTLPANIPVEVTNGAPSFAAGNIASSQILTTTMELGLKSHAYFYRAEKFAGCLFIYHSGHGEGITDEVKHSLWSRVVEGGCDLLYMAMPLMHQNPRPIVNSRFGPLLLKSHDTLALLQTESFNPLRFFFDPVLASLNHAISQRGSYRYVFMTGMSGGGWTTTLYAAIDPRISASFPVSGSLPVSLKAVSDPNIGDWEQYGADIYQSWDYLDFYALATYPARTQIQLLNVHDSCCFKGVGARLYAKPISQLVQAWGGSFSVVFDEMTHVHGFNARHIETILAKVAAMSGIAFPAETLLPNPCIAGGGIALTPPFLAAAGHAFQAMLPALENQADNAVQSLRSTAVLCEDGNPLGPPHSYHDTIRDAGDGAFSHWTTYLLFSTGDNSDPNTNNHTYTLLFPRP